MRRPNPEPGHRLALILLGLLSGLASAALLAGALHPPVA